MKILMNDITSIFGGKYYLRDVGFKLKDQIIIMH